MNVASLLAFPIDQHLSTLNEELRQIRTEAIEHGQFGGSRMALATRATCEKSLARAAEIILEQLIQSIESNDQDMRDELSAEAKDIFMMELSRFNSRIEQVQRENSGSYFQVISLNNLTVTYLARIEAFCVSAQGNRRNVCKQKIFNFIKWVSSTISGSKS